MKKLTTTFILIFLAGLVAGQNLIPVQSALGSSNSDANNPALAAIDGNSSTGWKLQSGNVSGWLALNLANPAQISGIQWAGTVATYTKATIWYQQNGVWKQFLAGVADTAGFVDLSLDRVVTNALQIRLDGNDAASSKIAEVQVLGLDVGTRVIKIHPTSISASDNTVWSQDENNLDDGNTSTTWKLGKSGWTDTSDDLDISSWWNGLKNFKRYHDSFGQGSAVFSYNETANLDLLKVFLPAVLNTDLYLEAQVGTSWTQLAHWGAGTAAGWQKVDVRNQNIATQSVRLRATVGFNSSVEIGELEVWAHGTTQGRVPTSIFTPNPLLGTVDLTYNSANAILNSDGFTAGEAFFVVSGNAPASLSLNLNGNALTAAKLTSLRGRSLYSVKLSNGQLWTGENYLRVNQNSGVLEDIQWSFCTREGVVARGAGALGDGVLYSSAAPNGTSTIVLTNPTQLERVEVTSVDPLSVTAQALVGANWVNLSSSSSSNGLYSFDGAAQLATQVKLSITGGAGEITVWGSEVNSTGPVIKILLPDTTKNVTGDSNDANGKRVVGWISDPKASVTIGALAANLRGHLFWINTSALNLVSGQENLVTVTATDSQNRQTSTVLHIQYATTGGITVDQSEATAYTAAPVYTISGSVQSASMKVFVNGIQVAVSGKRFSTTVALVEGLNLITIQLQKSNGTVVANLVRKVVRIAGGLFLAVDAPQNGGILTSPNVNVLGRVKGVGAVTVQVSVNGAAPISVQAAAGAFAVNNISLKEGSNTLAVTAIDSIGETYTQVLTVTRDTSTPQITSIVPASGSLLNTKIVSITVNVNAASWVKIGTSDWIVVSGGKAQTSLPLSEGFQTITIVAKNGAGTTSTALLKLTLDTIPPAPFTVTTNVTGWTKNNRPTITFSTTDSGSGIDHYEVQIDSADPAVAASPYQLPVLADGLRQILVRAYDKAGNFTTVITPIQVDTTAPLGVQNLRAIPGDGTMDVVWTTTDQDIVKYHVTRTPAWSDGEHLVVLPELKETGLTDGSIYSYSVWAEDHASNLGPTSQTSQSITGLAVAPVSTDPVNPALVEYQGMKVIVPAASLPDGNVAVLIKQIDSPTLRDNSSYPIVSPIYSLSTLAQTSGGNLQETSHSEFSKEVVMMLDYDPSQLPNGFPETNLGVYYWDTTWSKWFRVEKSAVDLNLHKIIFTTNHFTDFSVQPTMITDLSPQQLKDIGHNLNKTESSAGSVTVSPQGGTAMTEATDFVLQGKNGFTLPVKRIYDTGTALTDSPSLSLSASLSFNSIGDLLNAAGIAGQLVSQGVSGLVNAIKSKVVSMVQRNGDYALAAGVGWRLNLPYVSTNNTSVSVRLPNGGYYNINQMQSNNNFWTSNPVSRTLDFEYHEGEDFHFKVTQVRSNITDVSNFISGQVSSAISSSINNKLFGTGGGGGTSVSGVISMVASLIPGWTTVSSELWTKDGTYYIFDTYGRVVQIQDKTGMNTFKFHYNGLLLNDITDDLGRKVLFQYNEPSIAAAFARPVITKIWTKGFQTQNQSRTVDLNYNWSAAGPAGTFFNFLPTLTSTSDALGRQYSYSYNQQSIVTGGGAIKVNFLALLLDFIPGIGPSISNALGISALTLSGNLEINLPYTISRVVAPNIGTTDITVSAINLSQFDFKPTDYFLGLFPTALQVSYQILFRLGTTQVIVTSSSGVVKTTNYSYHWTTSSDNQYYVDHTTVNDGRTLVTMNYSAYEVSRNRFISWDDYLVSIGQSLFQQQGLTIQELFSLESNKTIVDVVTGGLLESVSNVWDTGSHRLLSSTVTRGASTFQTMRYSYDNWGNQTYVLEDQFSNGKEQKTERWMWYLNTNSSQPGNWTPPSLGSDDSVGGNTHDLVKGVVTRVYKPVEVGGGYDDRFQGFVYNSFGLKKTEGLWLGTLWSKTDYTYYTDPSLPTGGSIATKIGPLAGQETDFTYDYSRSGNFYTTTQTVKNVADPDGTITSIVTENANDWNTAWKLYDKDGLGYITEYGYDFLGRPTDTIKPGNETPLSIGNWSVVHTSSAWEHVAYDDNALTASVYKTAYSTGGTNTPGNLLEKYSYDSLSQLIQIEKFNYQGVSTPDDMKTVVTYTPWGDVASMTDPNGNKTVFAYDARGRITKVTHPDGTFIATTYDDSQNLKQTTNERGAITKEWLNWKEQDLVKIDDFGKINATAQIAYDGLDEVVQTIDPLGQKISTTYNAFGKPLEVDLPAVVVGTAQTSVVPKKIFIYDLAGQNTVQQIGSDGNYRETDFVYDNAGRVTSKTLGDRTERMWYDAAGRLVKHADGEGKVSTKSYTSRGQVASETDPIGAVVRYAYDIKDRKVQMKDPRSSANPTVTDSFTLNYIYNDLDRLVLGDLPPVIGQPRSSVQIFYDLRGNATKQIDPSGRITSWTYDSRNRKTSQTVTGGDGTGSLVNAWAYDSVGNVTKEIVVSSLNSAHPEQSAGLVTLKVYDNLNRLTDTYFPDSQEQHLFYDLLGRVTRSTDARGFETKTDYNSLNKPTTVTDALENMTTNLYDVWGEAIQTTAANSDTGDQIWSRSFDQFGAVTAESNNSGQTWSYLYNKRGFLVQSTDPNGIVSVNLYDDAGRIKNKTLTKDSHSLTKTWDYDLAGSLKTATDGSVVTKINQAGGSFIPYPYDLIGSYQTVIGPKTLNTAYTYDNAHNITSVTYPDSGVVNFQYNSMEQLTAIPGFASNGQYNFMGRLVSLSAPNGTKRDKTWNTTAGTLDGYNWNVAGKTARTIGWDNEGNIVSQTKDGSSSSYVYDQVNRLTYAQEGGAFELSSQDNVGTIYGSKTRDVAGKKALVFGNPNASVALDYYSSSVGVNLQSVHSINKVRLTGVTPRINTRTVELYISQDGSENSWTKLTDTSWNQDQSGVTLQFKTSHEAQFVKVHMTWDERDASNHPVDSSVVKGTPAQLIQVWFTVNGQTTAWTYDSLGNRLSEDKTRGAETLTSYAYYPNTSRIKTSGVWSFNYDANGNLIARGNEGTWNAGANSFDFDAIQGELWNYTYDLANRLVEVKHSTTGTGGLASIVTYVYDANNLRVAQTKAGVTTYYQFDQKGSLLYRDNGTETRRYIEALGQIWAEERTSAGISATYWHHTDHEGSTNVITDSNGHVVWDGDYEAFGSLVRSNGTLDFDASYTGKDFDKDTGLYYYNARFYDPILGRFLTEDPARAGANWYEYGNDNPLRFVDPSGLLPKFAELVFTKADGKLTVTIIDPEMPNAIGAKFTTELSNTQMARTYPTTNNEVDGPPLLTTPPDGGTGKPYIPGNFPEGSWHITEMGGKTDNGTKANAYVGPVFLATDAERKVETYTATKANDGTTTGWKKNVDKDGNPVLSKDAGLWLHGGGYTNKDGFSPFGNNQFKDKTQGCGRGKNDDLKKVQDMIKTVPKWQDNNSLIVKDK